MGLGLDKYLPGAKGAKQATESTDAQIAFQREMADTISKDAEPLLALRNTNLNRLTSMVGGDHSNFYNSPEYRGVRDAAMTVTGDAPAFASGALAERAKGLADSEYGNHYNRLTTLAGIGSDGLNTTNAQLQASTNFLSDLAVSGGEAAASALLQGSQQKNDTAMGVAGLFAAFSDAALKDDIEPLLMIGPLQWCQWRWKVDIAQPACGFIAQEVQKVCPWAVHRDQATGFLKVNYAEVFAWLCR